MFSISLRSSFRQSRVPLTARSLLLQQRGIFSPSFTRLQALTTKSDPDETSKQSLAAIQPRLSLTFTCTAPLAGPPPEAGATSTPPSVTETNSTTHPCSHRSSHTFTKMAYEKGIVLIECPSCKNRHLIADNLGWFKDDTQNGVLRNVEDILRAQGDGDRVQKGSLTVKRAGGDVEILG